MNQGVGYGGEGGIRTPGRGFPLRRFSKPLLSTTQPPLRRGSGRSSICIVAQRFPESGRAYFRPTAFAV
jgi:hypothetical protein